LPLLHAFAEPTDPDMVADIPSGHFRTAVRGAMAGRDIPHITAALIHEYATDLRRPRLLGP
jgi:fatty acid CoA ligase FadD9